MKAIGVRHAYDPDDRRLVNDVKIPITVQTPAGDIRKRTVKMSEAEYEAFQAIVARLLFNHKDLIKFERKPILGIGEENDKVEIRAMLTVQEER